MPKQALALLLFLLGPLPASAECGFAQDDDTMIIVVSKKSNKCFSSEKFRNAFTAHINETLNNGDSRVQRQKKPFDERNARGQKLWSIAEHEHQQTMATARYWGQTR